MRYELCDHEWTALKPMLPNKPRGVRRVSDRRVLNGIFWVLRSGAPWRDLPESCGPYTICYNRFVGCQAMSACRDPMRQTRGQLSGLHQTRFNPNLLRANESLP